MIRPPRVATASAHGRAASAVHMRPPVSTKSAGASAGPPTAATPRTSTAADTSLCLFVTGRLSSMSPRPKQSANRAAVAPSKIHEPDDSPGGRVPGGGALLSRGIGRCPEEARGQGDGAARRRHVRDGFGALTRRGAVPVVQYHAPRPLPARGARAPDPPAALLHRPH